MLETKIVELKAIIKNYYTKGETIEVLKNIELDITAGEMIAIKGPSGSGKTTLLNIIGSLDKPDSGKINICGYNLLNFSEAERVDFRLNKIGFIFQKHCLLPQLTVLENVLTPAIPLKNHPIDKAKDLLKKMGLDKRIDFFPEQLSHGEQQRTAVARALINSPALIIADEPTGALDKKKTGELMELLTALNSEDITIIMATHSDFAANFTKKTFYLEDGKLILL